MCVYVCVAAWRGECIQSATRDDNIYAHLTQSEGHITNICMRVNFEDSFPYLPYNGVVQLFSQVIAVHITCLVRNKKKPRQR